MILLLFNGNHYYVIMCRKIKLTLDINVLKHIIKSKHAYPSMFSHKIEYIDVLNYALK